MALGWTDELLGPANSVKRAKPPEMLRRGGAMPMHDVPEPDWKIFRELQKDALERFCKRALDEVQRILNDGSRTHHERYLDVFRLLRTRDEELAHAFNNPRRTTMIIQLAAIHAYGLLEPNEIGRFTDRTRTTIVSLGMEFPR
jgi:hypothetical protein